MLYRAGFGNFIGKEVRLGVVEGWRVHVAISLKGVRSSIYLMLWSTGIIGWSFGGVIIKPLVYSVS